MKINDVLLEFASANNPGGGNYLKALASAWYNGTFNTGDLHKGIKSQEDVERILERGIHCGDGKIRKYSIGYNSDFDGVEIQSDDHYEYSDYDDAGRDIDSRTGKPWGPYDVVAFGGNELDESVSEGSLNEFAPGGNSASSYYAVTANFVSEFSQQKEEEIQDLIAAGWTKQDLAQAGTLQGQAADIAHFEQVRDGFLKGLKPGFDAYLQGDTQMKDQLGEYWLDNDLPLNQDWEKIYGEPWGDDMDESVSNRALSEFSIGGDDDGEPKDDPYKYPKPEHYRRSIDFFGKFEANHFDKEDMDDATGVFKGYWYYGNKLKQIAYFKFDNPQRTGSNDPGMGWYYEPQDEDVAEAEQQKGADYRDPPEAEYGDDYQAMIKRMKKLAGAGPLKTVHDPAKRVYKNVPTAVQPKK